VSAWVAAWVLAVSIAITGGALGYLIGGGLGAIIVALLSVVLAIPFGRAVVQGRPYAGGMGAWRCLIDATWSSLNTWAGALYYALHRVRGNPHDLARSAGRGSIWLTRGVTARYATTIGTVKAGCNDRLDAHEEVHVLQARIFGPFYLPLVALNYVIATIIPYWLLFYDKQRYPITGFASYFHNGVYPHVWNELWAYRATRARPHT
jgi:hypothetical protein